MRSYFEIVAPNPPPVGWDRVGGYILLLLFSAVHDISRTFDFLTP